MDMQCARVVPAVNAVSGQNYYPVSRCPVSGDDRRMVTCSARAGVVSMPSGRGEVSPMEASAIQVGLLVAETAESSF